MDDRAANDMAAIKRRELAARAAIRRREMEVDLGSFTMGQMGLSPVVADADGGLWVLRGQTLVFVGAIE